MLANTKYEEKESTIETPYATFSDPTERWIFIIPTQMVSFVFQLNHFF